MAHLWLRDDEGWAVLPCAGPALALGPGGPRRLASGGRSRRARRRAEVLLLPPPAAGDGWLLLAGSGLRASVNGYPLIGGLRVLADRDEIRAAGVGTFFFSTERPAVVEPFPGGGGPKYCPRCKLVLEEDTPAVRCPGCGLFYHQSDEYGCWLYGDTCSACGWPTALDAGYRWTPEDL